MICPNCQIDAVITEDLYGALYTCSGCRAVYFINFEGQPEYGDVNEVIPDIVSGTSPSEPEALETSAPESMAPELENPSTAASLQTSQEAESFESSLEPLVDSVDMVSFDNKLDDQFNSQINDQNLQTNTPENQNIEMPPADFSNSELNPFEQQQPEVNTEIQNPSSFTNIAREISDFGNAEVQLSGLNYDLNITGLDSLETMRLFKEAIEDSKFGWNTSELLSTIKNGQIKFERLSPVKAYILAKRLQFLDIEKHWKQNAMS